MGCGCNTRNNEETKSIKSISLHSPEYPSYLTKKHNQLAAFLHKLSLPKEITSKCLEAIFKSDCSEIKNLIQEMINAPLIVEAGAELMRRVINERDALDDKFGRYEGNCGMLKQISELVITDEELKADYLFCLLKAYRYTAVSFRLY